MKAARIVKVNEPLQVQELQTPEPKGSQIIIKVQSSGVCHSDVHVWEGYYEGIGGQPLKTTDRGVKYPPSFLPRMVSVLQTSRLADDGVPISLL